MVQQNTVSRRAVAKGVAWSAPVIMASSTVPALASSCTSRQYSVTFGDGIVRAVAQDGDEFQLKTTGISAGVLGASFTIDFTQTVTNVTFRISGFNTNNGGNNPDTVAFTGTTPTQVSGVNYNKVTHVASARPNQSLTASVSYASTSSIAGSANEQWAPQLTVSELLFTACR